MAGETGCQKGDTPKEAYETIDGTPLEGTMREVLPQLYQPGGRVKLEDVLKSGTVVGEALRRTLAKQEQGLHGEKSITAVAATKKPAAQQSGK